MSDPAFRLAFLRTYETSGGLNGAEVRYVYDLVRDAADPESGRGTRALASELGVKRARIREWVAGDSIPDAVQGVRIADRRSWLSASREPHLTLTELCGAVIGGGWISAGTWSVHVPAANDHVRRLYGPDRLDVGVTTIERDLETGGYDDRITPSRDGSVLARVLFARGVPVGRKRDVTLPEYLHNRVRTARAFARGYAIARRGAPAALPAADRIRIPIHDRRSAAFLETLTAIFEVAIDGPITVSEAPNSPALIIPESTIERRENRYLLDPSLSLYRAHM